ncbi:DUF2339 domain-containing protein [Sulfurovum sp.]|uniref:DUF2339 domain-containing protein n=1 Tax=Sulfurovum sp. TaxID=1969726 RepID=UPI0025D65D39|nr:DUF2339 domain-containing protein [Sulfurovum sp.]
MNISAFWLIVLSIWIFILQSRVKDLEKTIQRLKDKKPYTPAIDDETPIAVQENAEENETPQILPPVETEESDETVHHAEVFRQSYDREIQKEPAKPASFIANYFTQGNLLVRIGGIVLFFGLAFLVKYAAEHSIISMQMRLEFIAVAAVALVITGWKLREREGAYGQILQGLGIAMLYLVIYAAAKFYAMLPLDTAFALMFMVVVLGSVLAVRENALPLALFATAGGFLVPILTSNGEGSHIILFSYYVFLNLGVFIVAWHRSWRLLNVVGFLFTFVIATIWGVLRYRPELFNTTEPFLILYFVMYLTISILFTLKHTFKPKNFVDSTLVFGLPLFAFPLQVSLVKPMEYGEACSALVLGTLYLILSRLLGKRERTALLAQAFLALGVVFYTIAIPYLFDADVTAALWSLEGSALIWMALKQEKPYARYFGEMLVLLSIVIYPDSVSFQGISPVEYLGYIIVITSSLIASYLLDSYQRQLSASQRLLARIFLGLSLFLWFTCTPSEFLKLDNMLYSNALLFSLASGAFLLFVVSRMSIWKLLTDTLQGYILLGILFFFTGMTHTLAHPHPFEGFGALALGILFFLGYLFLYTYGHVWKYTKQIHILSLWFMTAVFMLELRYHAELLHAGKSIVMVAVAVVPVLFSFWLLLPKKYISWMEIHRNTYQFTGAGGLVTVLIFWELAAFRIAPDFSLLPYIPVLNLLDMMQIAVLGTVFYWIYHNRTFFPQNTRTVLYALTVFISVLLASVIFARTVHSFKGVDYTLVALWKNIYFQSGLSILWSTIAIIAMLLSKRYSSRLLWLSGFGLLILVVLKLFFVELASSGTIERIISFIVVGSLLLLIGYFVPLPPNESKEER